MFGNVVAAMPPNSQLLQHSPAEVKFRWVVDDWRNPMHVTATSREDGNLSVWHEYFHIQSPNIASRTVGIDCDGSWFFRVVGCTNVHLVLAFSATVDRGVLAGVKFRAVARFESSHYFVGTNEVSLERAYENSLNIFPKYSFIPPAGWTAERLVIEVTAVFPDDKLMVDIKPKVVREECAAQKGWRQVQEMADVCLISADNQRLKVSRLVLAKQFGMFVSLLQQKSVGRQQAEEFVFTDVDIETLRIMVEAICGVDITKSLSPVAEKVFLAADKYKLEDLKAKCGELLQKTLTVGNAVKRYQFAKRHGLSLLTEKSVEFIHENLYFLENDDMVWVCQNKDLMSVLREKKGKKRSNGEAAL